MAHTWPYLPPPDSYLKYTGVVVVALLLLCTAWFRHMRRGHPIMSVGLPRRSCAVSTCPHSRHVSHPRRTERKYSLERRMDSSSLSTSRTDPSSKQQTLARPSRRWRAPCSRQEEASCTSLCTRQQMVPVVVQAQRRRQQRQAVVPDASCVETSGNPRRVTFSENRHKSPKL